MHREVVLGRIDTRRYVFLAILAFFVLIASYIVVQKTMFTSAAPGINKTINFQGKMTDDQGLNVANGSYQFVFRLYTLASGGSATWTETVTLSVTDGIFQHNLGSVTALPGAVDFDTDNIFLGITFNSDPDGEMTPRIQLTATPYAFNADQLDGLDASDFVQISPSVAQAGNIAITGSVSAGSLVLSDGSSNTATVEVDSLAGDYVYTIPTTTGHDTFCLEGLANCAGGGGGISSIGTIDSQTKSANGAVIIGSDLVLQTADVSNPGLVSTAAQVFAGAKTFNGAVIAAANGAASTPSLNLSGTWFTGGTATTTKPQLLVQPSAATSNNWSTAGTGLGINSASGFTGNLIDAQVNGSRRFAVDREGVISLGNTANTQMALISAPGAFSSNYFRFDAGGVNDVVAEFRDCCNYIFQVKGTGTPSFFNYGLDVNGVLSTNTIRSLSGNIVLGQSNTTGTLLVLDIKTNAGDPTGVNGGMYYNSNAGAFRFYQNGSWFNLGTGDILNGGNPSAITIGTNDSSALTFETNNTARWNISSAGHLLPSANDTYDIGSDTLRVRDLYLGGETIYIGAGSSNQATIGYNSTSESLVFRNATNSAEAWQVQNASGTKLLAANTNNNSLEVYGDIYSAGLTWTPQTAAEETNWGSVAYGNGRFVAIARSGTNQVMTSSDGITWTPHTAAEANNWVSITYGNGLFVAVSTAGTNRVMTSPDGINWTARAAAEANQWWGITYGNGLFVAVGITGTNRVMTSPDGITWTPRAAAEANSWREVTYANGLFVAVASDGTNRTMYSTDGITWTSGTDPADTGWWGVAYGNGRFVAVGQSTGSRVMHSTDGMNWTSGAAAETNNWTNVTYGGGLFVAIAQNGTNRVMTSPDGITWTPRAATAANQWWGIAYGNGMFVATSLTGTDRVMTSGKTELTLTPPNNIYQGGMEVRGGMRVANTAMIDAFQVQTTGGGALLAADTLTDRVYVGQYTPPLLANLAGAKLEVVATQTGLPSAIWTPRTAAQANQWRSVTYGNGLFVALTNGSAVMTSIDGINWTARTAPQSNNWGSITYGNGLFVAVSQNGTNRVMTSPDGITWTLRNATEANQWRSVTYGNGLFVAVASNGTNRVMTSPDGITWTPRTATEPIAWYSVTYGSGLFVAVATGALAGTDLVMTSPDGITWTPRNVPGSLWYSVTYGNGLFVAVGYSSVITSPDGITWTSRSGMESANWLSVTYGNGLFVAVATNGTNRIKTSPDGITWTLRAAPEANSWYGVAYGNGLFVAVSDDGTNRVMTMQHDNGLGLRVAGNTEMNGTLAVTSHLRQPEVWTPRAAAQANMWFSITYGNGLFVAISRDGTNRVMTSPDGITWTPRTAAQANDWRSITYGNGLFVAVGHSGTNRVMTSPDGITWTPRTATEANYWQAVTYGNGLFVAVSNNGTNRVMTSPDGITWTPRAAAENNDWDSVAYGNGMFVAVSWTGTNRVMTSPDGITWTPRAAALSNWRSVVYGNSLFVAVSNGGTHSVMTSPDGITWTPRTASIAGWHSVVYGNGTFVAVGTDVVMSSPDGINWASHTPAQINWWKSVAYGNGVFVAVSDNGTNRVMTSGGGYDNALTATGNASLQGDVTIGGQLRVLSDAYFGGSLLPTSNDLYSLGSDTNRWKDLYVGGSTIHIGTSSTDEGLISYDTANNILNFGTDSTSNGDIAFFGNQLYLDKGLGNVAIGTTSPGANDKLSVQATYSNTSGNSSVIRATGSVSAASSDVIYNLHNTVNMSHTSGTHAGVVGQQIQLNLNGSGGTTAHGSYFSGWSVLSSGHTVANLRGIDIASPAISSGATLSDWRGVNVNNPGNSGTLTNNYGMYIANQTAGTNNYGLYIDGASTRALHVNSGSSYFGGAVSVTGALNVSQAIISGSASGGALGADNPANASANVMLSWLNDVPRIRYGGSGAGSANGFQIQGTGDAIKLAVSNAGSVTIPGTYGYTAATTGDKILLYGTSYGMGIESNTLTGWSASQFRWRTGGTSTSSGTERMLLTTTGLTLAGGLTFGQANPTISSSSYVVMPGGLYVNGGTMYVQNTFNARGIIQNDSTGCSGKVCFNDELLIMGTVPANDLTFGNYFGNGQLFVSGGALIGGLMEYQGTNTGGAGTLCWATGGIMNTAIRRCASSERFKHNIQSVNYGLAEVRQMRPVTFNWNEDGKASFGMIAEEMAAINPLFATYENDGVTIQGIHYQQLTAVLAGAIKELDVQVQTNDVRLSVVESSMQNMTIDVANLASSSSVQTLATSVTARLDTLEQGIFTSLTVSGPAVFNSTLTVTGDTFVQNITVAGKIITAGATPLAEVLGASTIDKTIDISGNDTAGELSLVLGTGASVAAGEQLSIEFTSAYGAKPRVNLTPVSAAAAGVRYYVEPTLTGFTLYFTDPPTIGETYSFNYFIVQ